jgi:serine/threonine-protein kinase
MPLKPGTRLGVYEIVEPIGAGGMGVVYRARDTKLNRDVALKAFPDAFALDQDRVARFRREAQLLASLNHANIAAIYGFEETNDTRVLVLELVDGLTLADRIGQGPLALDDAMPIARQIAEALDAAHEQGIIHRDLKPANVKVRADGTVKVLDFGLAKALTNDIVTDVSLTRSPTITSPVGITGTGVLLGTAAYMAPEQARGRTIDKRADIWAFGCVLFEMLAGRRAFEGDTVADVLATVITREPDFNALPATLPDEVVALIRHCLHRDTRRRLRDIGDAVAALDRAVTGSNVQSGHADTSRSSIRRGAPWAVAAAGVLVAIAATFGRPRETSPTRERLVVLEAGVGADASLVNDQGPSAVLSPDGASLAFTARSAGEARQLYVRRLDQLKAMPLPGTEDAQMPFFSPEGEWIAFFASGKLKKVPAAGGPVIELCDAPTGRGGSWGEDNSIIFTPNASGGTSLQRVNANGGVPAALTTLREGEAAQRWPQVLPGARAVLYSTTSNLGNYNDGNIVVQPLPEGDAKVVVNGGHFGRYLRSGHLTYVHDGRLFAIAFDLERLETVGSSVPVLERVLRTVQNGAAQFDASATGTAVYVADQPAQAQRLQWLTRDGVITSLPAAPTDWSNLRISPDGQRLAFDRFDGRQTDVWIYDWARDVMSQLTFDPAEDWLPVWTPDGARVVFRSTRRQFAFNLHWQRADNAGQSEALTDSRNPLTPASWHPDGSVFALVENNPTTNYDIALFSLDQKAGSTPAPLRPFLNTSAQETHPAFSPDGRWIAYVSNEGGRSALYVRPYPAGGGQWFIAQDGTHPTWSRARRELVYLGRDQRLMIAAYTVEGDVFRPEPARPWASARAVPRMRGLVGFDGRAFDLHPDGMRAIGAWTSESASVAVQNAVVVAFNFFDELRRLAPAAP